MRAFEHTSGRLEEALVYFGVFALFFVSDAAWAQMRKMPIVAPGALGNLGVHLLFHPSPGLFHGLPVRSGAYVDRVVHGGPADRSGLHAGDIVVRIGRFPITDAAQVNDLIATGMLRPGQTVTVLYWRNGQASTTTLEVSEVERVFPGLRAYVAAAELEERYALVGQGPVAPTKRFCVFRDASGRASVEEFVAGPGPGGFALRRVQIFDPVGAGNVFLDCREKTATVIVPGMVDRQPAQRSRERSEWVEDPSTELGHRMIDGFQCSGYRLKATLENPDVVGGDRRRPLVYTSEQWTAETNILGTPLFEVDENNYTGRVVTSIAFQ